jgi:formylglycine-generating enzyme required for sulfatase activity
MAAKVFISYRRDDDPAAAARVRDGLARKFGNANLFIDVDDLLAGQRFDEELAKALKRCDVLIAVLGERWMELLKAKTANSERDHVREEIAAALQRQIVVIPVRIGREGQLPPLPRTGDLPSDISDLILYQKHDVTHEHFGRDIAELVEAIRVVRRLNRPKSAVRQVHWGWIGAIAAGVLVIAYVGVNNLGILAWWQGSPAAIPGPGASQVPTTEQSRADRRQAEAEAERRADEEAKAESNRKQAEAEAKRRADEAAKAEADRKQAEAQRRADEEAARRDPALSIAPASGQSFRDQLANGEPCAACPEMVVAPAGTFTMGSPPSEAGHSDAEVQVRVTIARPFAVGKFAVTFDQWDACVADGGCNGYRPPDHWGRGNRPVINVNWNDATAYAEWLSGKTGKAYRLLSEAEREYVTRAGTTTPFWWGSSITPNQANYDGNGTYAGGPKGENRQRTVPVDNFEANPWGLFNVHGNVFDWTTDCWNASNQGNPGNGNARATGDCSLRVVRGGSWYFIPLYLRAAYRYRSPFARSLSVGFRLARTLNP